VEVPFRSRAGGETLSLPPALLLLRRPWIFSSHIRNRRTEALLLEEQLLLWPVPKSKMLSISVITAGYSSRTRACLHRPLVGKYRSRWIIHVWIARHLQTKVVTCNDFQDESRYSLLVSKLQPLKHLRRTHHRHSLILWWMRRKVIWKIVSSFKEMQNVVQILCLKYGGNAWGRFFWGTPEAIFLSEKQPQAFRTSTSGVQKSNLAHCLI